MKIKKKKLLLTRKFYFRPDFQGRKVAILVEFVIKTFLFINMFVFEVLHFHFSEITWRFWGNNIFLNKIWCY